MNGTADTLIIKMRDIARIAAMRSTTEARFAFVRGMAKIREARPLAMLRMFLSYGHDSNEELEELVG
jgi:hypothetical protein